MARKSIKGKSNKSTSARIRLPKSWRVVTARTLRKLVSDARRAAPKREVPKIRLSGEWLSRIGFAKGRRYLISADRAFETIYLQADPKERKRR
jgi:hypothetical protein